jgi:hypothetical protein
LATAGFGNGLSVVAGGGHGLAAAVCGGHSLAAAADFRHGLPATAESAESEPTKVTHNRLRTKAFDEYRRTVFSPSFGLASHAVLSLPNHIDPPSHASQLFLTTVT